MASEKILFVVLRNHFELLEATLRDHLQTRSKAGLPTLLEKRGSLVNGGLALGLEDRHLSRLDDYFGPNYFRKTVEVEKKGERIAAGVHVLREGTVLFEGRLDSPKKRTGRY